MTKSRKGKSKVESVSTPQSTVAKVLVLRNTYANGIFYKAGDTIVVSVEFYNRIRKENDTSFKPL